MSSPILSHLVWFALGLAVGVAILHLLRRKSIETERPLANPAPALMPARNSDEVELLRRIADLKRELEAANAKLAAKDRIEHTIALSDALTGVANRSLLAERIDHAIVRGRRHNARLGVLILGLNNFKAIDEQFGRPAADKLLIAIARKLRDTVRSEDTVARLVADRFAIALEGVFEREDVDRAIESVMRVFAEPFAIEEQPVTLTVSVGSALFPSDGEDAESLLRVAEHALSQGKKRNRKVTDPSIMPAS